MEHDLYKQSSTSYSSAIIASSIIMKSDYDSQSDVLRKSRRTVPRLVQIRTNTVGSSISFIQGMHHGIHMDEVRAGLCSMRISTVLLRVCANLPPSFFQNGRYSTSSYVEMHSGIQLSPEMTVCKLDALDQREHGHRDEALEELGT